MTHDFGCLRLAMSWNLSKVEDNKVFFCKQTRLSIQKSAIPCLEIARWHYLWNKVYTDSLSPDFSLNREFICFAICFNRHTRMLMNRGNSIVCIWRDAESKKLAFFFALSVSSHKLKCVCVFACVCVQKWVFEEKYICQSSPFNI